VSGRGAVDPLALRPMLATRTESLPTGAGWAFEAKWDGIRALVLVRDGELRITSRLGNDLSGRYPELLGLVDALAGHTVLLDGEIVAFDDRGRPSFQELQRRMHVTSPTMIARLATEVPAAFIAFDVLWEDGEDLTGLAYRERRARLEALGVDGPSWQTPAVVDDGPAMFAASQRLGLEGVVAKRVDSRYEPGRRSRAWLKIKHQLRQELVVGGWLPGEGSRAGTFGALLLGYQDDDGLLQYAGRVGTGFDADALELLLERLGPRARSESPFARGSVPRGARFVEPDLVVEVRFSEWTHDGVIRHPVYLGLRVDRDPATVVRET
jgi:bifunctional non-homologous end joining protein LigD